MRSVLKHVSRFRHLNCALADQAVVSAGGFLTTVLLARYLGIEEFGVFTIAWTVVLYADGLQHAFITAPMMSFAPGLPGAADRSRYFASVAMLQVISALCAAALIYASAHAVGHFAPEWNVASFAWPLAATASATGLQNFLRRYLFTNERGQVALALDALRYVGQVAVVWWVLPGLRAPPQAENALWLLAVVAALPVGLGALVIRGTRFSISGLRASAGRHWSFGRWLAASAATSWLESSIFLVAAGTVLGASSVGAMKAAQSLMGITHIYLQGLENVVPVEASRRLSGYGAKALRDYLRRVAYCTCAATALVGLSFSAVPAFWLDLVFGAQFAHYGYLVWFYAIIYTLSALNLPLTAGLRTFARTRPIFTAHLAAVAVAAAAAYPFAQAMGLPGLMAGMLLEVAVAQVVLWHALRPFVRARTN